MSPFPVPLYDDQADETHTLLVRDLGDGQLVGQIRTVLEVDTDSGARARLPVVLSVALGTTQQPPEDVYRELASWLHGLARAAEHELSGA